MFCSKCGKEIPDGSAFCANCGANLGSGDVAESHKAPLTENISFTEKPEREQTTINMHQKMGWTLKSSQEINTSQTSVYSNSANGISSYTTKEHYIKLVFERAKNMPNYNILKEKYENFTKLADQIAVLEASVEKRSKKFYLCFALLIPLIMSILALLVFLSIIVDAFFVFDFIMITLLALFLIVCYAVSLGIVLPIAMKIAETNVKKKIKPVVSKLYEQMNSIANDSENYL